jgi:hypothetical protein
LLDIEVYNLSLFFVYFFSKEPQEDCTMIRRLPWQVFSLGVLGLTLGWSQAVWAAAPDTAPRELVNALEQIEIAANAQNLDGVMAFYSDTFTNSDGFDQTALETALGTLWDQYPDLTYRIELQSWEPVANGGYMAETITYIDGTSTTPREMTLEAVIRSRQQFEAGKIVSQETLSERNQASSGDAPPTVTVLLPERAEPGQGYSFDTIVQEPLGDRYLLGTALEEGTTSTDFFTARPLDLELLTAGGLFKLGDAPEQADNLWLSAVLIRNDGVVVVTRRLRVD